MSEEKQLNMWDEEVLIPQKLEDKSLFKDKFSPQEIALIKVLETHCVTYSNKKKAKWILPEVNVLLSSKNEIKDDFELRMIIKKLRGSETYLRVIGSTSAGIWLACNGDEVKPNDYMVSRIESSIRTALKNGVGINLFYEILNNIKNPELPVDNQTRHQFNTEKKIIKRYSDDLMENAHGHNIH